MGYCTGNLCVHRGGFSMSYTHHGSFLKRAVLLSLRSEMKMMSHMTGITRLHTLSVSLHKNTLPAMEASTSLSLHTHMITYCRGNSSCKAIATKAALGMHLTHHGVEKQHGFSTWRVFSSLSESHELLGGSDMSTHEQQSMLEDLTISSKGPSKAKKCVVVVESPTKAKTIEKYLGPHYVVLPTYGHVRDLAARVGSVRPDEDYAMVWEVPEAAHTHISRIKQALKGAEYLILASDPDREGEAIAWHVSELLKDEGVLKGRNLKVVRVTFNEITKGSVLRAMEGPRDISSTLVTAYLARRALDHLIGFALSPVLWRKLPGSKSAGRVQSVALKLVCEREKEIEEFVPQEFWTVEAYAGLEEDAGERSLFPIRPTHIDERKIDKFLLGSDDAKSLTERISNLPLRVSSVQRRSKRRNPLPPYITSTLQMDAQSKLGYGAVRTMTLAQKLYEGIKLENEQLTGLITYMRTDGLQLSSEAVKDIRALVGQRYGENFVPTEYRKFNSKVKNAQEAHEAIRPTDIYRLPSKLVPVLEKDALLLYTLIWKRTVACQMEQALYEEASVNFVTEDESICLQAGSSLLSFSGFLAAMEDNDGIKTMGENVVEGETEQDDVDVGKYTHIFSLKKNDIVVVKRAESRQHFTRSPARFSEGLLVKAMEELGIGRPSTYATMLKTLESRNYVKIEHHRITPEARGRMVATFLSHYFPKYIDYDFTARLEEQLDEVSGGQIEWKEVLRGFWPEFESVVASSMKVPVPEVIEMLQETLASHCFKGLGINGHTCPSCGEGKLTLKLSRFGSGYFFGCNRYPDCSFKAQLLGNENVNKEEPDNTVALKTIQSFDALLGVDPDTNLEVRVRKGPYGYYIQLGEEGKQRRNFKIPERVNPSDLTLVKAKELMKFPLSLGKHPEDGELVTLCIGKTSYYVRHRNALASVPKNEIPLEVTLERAVDLLKGKKVRYIGHRGKTVSAAAEKNGSLRQQKTGRNAAVSSAKKVTKLSTSEAEDSDPKPKKVKKLSSMEVVEGEPNAMVIRKQRTSKAEGKDVDSKARKATKKLNSTEAVESEPQAKRIRKQKTLKSGDEDGNLAFKNMTKLSSIEVVEGESQAKKTRKQRTTKTEVVTKPSSDNLEVAEPKAKRLPRSKSIESAEGDKLAKKSTVKKKGSSSELNAEGDATVDNDSDDRRATLRLRRKKGGLAVEIIDDEPKAKTLTKTIVNIEGETKLENIARPSNGSIKEGKLKAKSSSQQKRNDSTMSDEITPPFTGEREVSIEGNENGKPKLGRKSTKLAVDENVQSDLEARQPDVELRSVVSSNERVRMSSRRKSTQASA